MRLLYRIIAKMRIADCPRIIWRDSVLAITLETTTSTRLPIAVLEQRKELYEAARNEHPERWSGGTRNWDRPETVSLNPDKSDHQKKQELTQTQS